MIKKIEQYLPFKCVKMRQFVKMANIGHRDPRFWLNAIFFSKSKPPRVINKIFGVLLSVKWVKMRQICQNG